MSAAWVLPEIGDEVEAQDPTTGAIFRGPVSRVGAREFSFDTPSGKFRVTQGWPYSLVAKAGAAKAPQASSDDVALTFCAQCGITYSSPHVHDSGALPKLPSRWRPR